MPLSKKDMTFFDILCPYDLYWNLYDNVIKVKKYKKKGGFLVLKN